ncbi:enhancer of yellow 2 transcription factor-like protein B-like protein [Piromyces finnis]|uniref:Transcription and mRNA export factor SUS1 n=1 Tax=Piromyces finnis TaxID=1754191 RepID=A0A1Y1VG02_9FUNG|nr:enhancer of yellow 2 transcription factor-like protein B-like protein [Piromyces finnis]|eukprot:ORX54651.1 enhancer of yellow 2 transcription factor-like protein B-like protein [Piromyces finnis]
MEAEDVLTKEEMRTVINQRLVDSGEKQRLINLARTRLNECGWKEEVKKMCKEIIQTRGVEYVKIEDLMKELTPKATSLVPENIKTEILQKISDSLQDQAQ